MQKYKLSIEYLGFGNEHVTGLSLYNKGIKRIDEIPGLENLTNLEELYLFGNQITEIKGLENLTNLKKLDLYGNELNSDSKGVIKSLRERGIKVKWK